MSQSHSSRPPARVQSHSTRVVGYCRTSSEAQRDNTSIPVQKGDIERYATGKGWTFLRHYVDESKSGSRIEGRDQFQKLMKDAANGEFNAVLVYDMTRFSRKGLDMLTTAETLKTAFGVRVLDTKGSYDSFDAGRIVVNFVNAGVAEDERVRILGRFKKGKVQRAQEGQPVSSVRPFGRLWDGKTKTWSIDEGKREFIESVASRYLKGESLEKIAQEAGVNYPQLLLTLKTRCGDTWDQRVRCKELGMDELIVTPVPRLLPEDVILAVRARSVANKKYHRGAHHKNTYLLAGSVLCPLCGGNLCGQVHHGIRWYRHNSRAQIAQGCPARCVRVEAGPLEDAVYRDLFALFGNPAAVQRAVEAATPDRGKVEEQQRRRRAAEAGLSKVRAKQARVVDAIADGTLTHLQAKGTLDTLTAQEALLRVELDSVKASLANTPTPEQVQAAGVWVSGVFRRYAPPRLSLDLMAANSDFDGLSPEDARELCGLVFGGLTAEGKRRGVYVEPASTQTGKGARGRGWKFKIVGRLCEQWGRTGAERVVDPEYGEFQAPVRATRELLAAGGDDSYGPYASTIDVIPFILDGSTAAA